MKRRLRITFLVLILASVTAFGIISFSQLDGFKTKRNDVVELVIATSTGTTTSPNTFTPSAIDTIDPYVLTLTAYPTFPAFPTSLLTPNPNNLEGTPNTPTPDLYVVTTVTVEEPPTPLPLGKSVDLTNGTPVPLEQLVIFTVERSDGTADEYRVPPWLLQNVTDAYLNELMEIRPGDRLLGWLPGVGGNQPPNSDTLQLSTVTP